MCSGAWSATLDTNDAIRIASKTLRLSEEPAPSVPIATFTPRSSMRRASAIPEPSFMFEPGLCDTDAPRSASRARSSSSSHTACAAQNPGPIRPSESRWATSVLPYFRCPTTACIFDSPTCIWMPTSSSRARSRQPVMNSSEQ